MSKGDGVVIIGGFLFLAAGAWISANQALLGVNEYLKNGKTIAALRFYTFAALTAIAFLFSGSVFLFYGVG